MRIIGWIYFVLVVAANIFFICQATGLMKVWPVDVWIGGLLVLLMIGLAIQKR